MHRKRTFRKDQLKFEQAALPEGAGLSGNTTFPVLHVKNSLSVTIGFGIEAERMVLSPLLSVRSACQ